MDGSTSITGKISFSQRADGRRYFTHADMARMVEDGVLDPEDRWELIGGDWFDMPSEGFEHMTVRAYLMRTVILQLGSLAGVLVNSENSVFLSPDTEVRPDLIIYSDSVQSRHMRGDDIHLIVEIMATSQHRDEIVKRPAYAAAGVPELWLIDLDAQTLRVCRAPVDGLYREETVFSAAEAISPQAFPQITLKLADLLPASSES